MKLKALCGLLSLSLVTSIAFADDATPANSSSNKDGQLIDMLVVLNKNEVAAAKLAQHRSHNKQVKAFANLMIKDHSKNLQETLKLSRQIKEKPQSSDDALSLSQQGKDELKMLKDEKGTNFDTAYMNAMVKDHEAAAKLLSDNLIPNAGNPRLKEHLEATNKHIDHHLEKAKEIQTEIEKA